MTDERKLPGLDGLRAISVAFVLLFHQYVFPFGWIGVQIFFVLSGFLITRLLHRARNQPLGPYLRGFYGRRALRIFPLYYAVLAGLTALALTPARAAGLRESLPYAYTYTYNFYYALRASGYSYLITHFWTLCVEEQFYLVWPFVIFFCSERNLPRLLLGLVLTGPLVRLVLAHVISPAGATPLDWHLAFQVLTPTHVDAFAIGAYVSLYPVARPRPALAAASAVFFSAGLFLVLKLHQPWLSFGYPIGMGAGYAYVWGYSLVNLCSALLIATLARRELWPAFFEARPIAYLGKISYGLYIIHYPIQSGVEKVLPHGSTLAHIALQSVITVALASASFYLWEARFLRLKDRWFPNVSTAKVAPQARAS
jgi:peptidoglycan/LPS O-acetylase OafA/YrhL